jgi:hypothetical protein
MIKDCLTAREIIEFLEDHHKDQPFDVDEDLIKIARSERWVPKYPREHYSYRSPIDTGLHMASYRRDFAEQTPKTFILKMIPIKDDDNLEDFYAQQKAAAKSPNGRA